jgi:hypothetical protein
VAVRESRVLGQQQADAFAVAAVADQARARFDRSIRVAGHRFVDPDSLQWNRSVTCPYSDSWPPNPSSGSMTSAVASAVSRSPTVLRSGYINGPMGYQVHEHAV